MSNLNRETIRAIVSDCFFDQAYLKEHVTIDMSNPEASPDPVFDDVAKAEGVIVKSVVSTFFFNKAKVAEHKEEIAELLAQLPDSFREDIGGGMSLLAAVENKNGNQWGSQMDAADLFAVAEAAELAEPVLPREFWSHLPGGLPYFVILASE